MRVFHAVCNIRRTVTDEKIREVVGPYTEVLSQHFYGAEVKVTTNMP